MKEIYNWASHFKHFQSILMVFDPVAAPTESTMVRYFEEGLKLSTKAEIDLDTTHLNDYEELITKVVRAEAKAGLWLNFYIREANQ